MSRYSDNFPEWNSLLLQGMISNSLSILFTSLCLNLKRSLHTQQCFLDSEVILAECQQNSKPTLTCSAFDFFGSSRKLKVKIAIFFTNC